MICLYEQLASRLELLFYKSFFDIIYLFLTQIQLYLHILILQTNIKDLIIWHVIFVIYSAATMG
jgi:hypothetical protein